ncbi:headcase protein isoform X2 [Drosophila mojavensis]|uniref:headcase protein isoform X2 n=1 Tax=Drosophila mojavensis TaxID=7230 RepID=UPI001CD0C279|nr:headcase protein isoform X2 [Drosophila mojavensis]XP_043863423.1 headcase protein isoform X2 [Drosophila mojavensis]
MAPRRSSSSGNSQQQQQQQQQLELQLQQQQQQQELHLYNSTLHFPTPPVNMAPMQQTLSVGVQLTRCCYPNGECTKLDTLIALDDQSRLGDYVRVVCNNENCNEGQYMHRDCFEQWEAGVLQQLKASARGRSWSERQRVQQLWTKKGYDLVYKNCSCKCGRGHLRKDLEWPPTGICFQRSLIGGGSGSDDDDKKAKAKKKRNRNTNGNANNNNNNNNSANNLKQGVVALAPINTNAANITPNPNVGVIGSGLPHNNNSNASNNNSSSNNQATGLQPSVVATLSNILMSNNNNNNSNGNNNNHNVLGLDLRARAGSLSSSGSSSPSASQSSADSSLSPVQQQQLHYQQQQQQQQLQLLQQQQQHNGLGLAKCLLQPPTPSAAAAPQLPSLANISGFKPLASYDQQQLVQQQKNKEVEIYSERVRSTSGCNGIFSRRVDFSSFNLLPKTRLNSYQVKVCCGLFST